MPITEQTHELVCDSASCRHGLSTKRLALIAQRACKQMTGYFAGYISKRQPVGKYELKAAATNLAPLLQKMQGKKKVAQWAKVVAGDKQAATTTKGCVQYRVSERCDQREIVFYDVAKAHHRSGWVLCTPSVWWLPVYHSQGCEPNVHRFGNERHPPDSSRDFQLGIKAPRPRCSECRVREDLPKRRFSRPCLLEQTRSCAEAERHAGGGHITAATQANLYQHLPCHQC